MANTLSDKFPANEFHIDEEGMNILALEFKSLAALVKAGAYVVEAKGNADADPEVEGVFLSVVIKPSAQNSTSSIETMAFEFKREIGERGARPIVATTNIKTKDGKHLSNVHELTTSYAKEVNLFLPAIMELGQKKIQYDGKAPQRAVLDIIKNIKP
jgi:FAD synthase